MTHPANVNGQIFFETNPSLYRHWQLSVEGQVATLTMNVDEKSGLFEGYELKLNSYDLGVDIELADAVQRLRFEHPEVRVVLMRSGKDRVFCAGANIRMLAGSTHAHKVNFCKFTNETRNTIEEVSETSGQKYICVVTGAAAGGGYELALATDHIMLVDDGSSSVALPELPLLAVLPGTGGLTRVTDKRKVRRDLADVFCTIEEGIKGRRAVEWKLVDEIIPRSKVEEVIGKRVDSFLKTAKAAPQSAGVKLPALQKQKSADMIRYKYVTLEIDRAARLATITIKGPDSVPASVDALYKEGADSWGLCAARELDDAQLYLRLNEPQLALLAFKTIGDGAKVVAYDNLLDANQDHWFAFEVRHFWKRVLKRVDVTARSIVTLIEPGSCFAGTLAELAFAADRSYMLSGQFKGDNRAPAALTLSAANFGALPMCNGLTRLETRFLDDAKSVAAAKASIGQALDAEEAEELGLVTFCPDDIDWEVEVRVFLEERASFSPDGLTGMEANLRFGGPETMESKIFSRLTAWQNWIFQRPNAVGPEGALKRYGTGVKPDYDFNRV